jgi:hypothetical protein
MERPIIVAVGALGGLLEKLGPVFKRASLEVHQVSLVNIALQISASRKPDLLIVAPPLSDIPLLEFVKQAGESLDGTGAARIVMLVEQHEQEQLGPYLDKSHILLPADAEPELLQRKILQLIGRSKRVAKRLTLRLEVQIGAGKVLRMYQTDNLSTTGMLLLTDDVFPLGSEVNLEFSLPGHSKPVRATAEIVRQAVPEVDGARGIGLRFTGFEGLGDEILKEYLSDQLATG